MRLRRIWWLLPAIGVGLLVQCQPADKGPAREGEQEPVPGGTVVIAFPAEPDVLNSLIRNSSYSGQILALLQDSAMEMDEELNWQPKIADRYSLAPDGLSLTYHLRPWRWSDGTPLTAYDLATTFRLLLSPAVASPLRGLYSAVKGAVALDSFTVRYDLHHRLPEPISRTSHSILPSHLIASLDPAAIRTWPLNEKPLSSGQFVLASWDHNHELVLVRNENYSGRPARLERLVFRIIPEETSRVVALETGAVDFLEELPIEAADRLRAEGKVNVHRVSGRLFGYLSWNFANPIFEDRLVRKAISLAIDRSRFVDGLMKGYATPAASPLPPALWAHNRAVLPDPHDPGRAQELLAAAGWTDGDGDGVLAKEGCRLSFEVLTRHGDPVRENGVVIIRENLRQVGIEVIPRVLEHATTLQMIRNGQFDAYLGLFQANMYVDPSSLVHSEATDRYNHGGYCNAEVDSLLAVALALTDRRSAKPVWDRLQEVLAADLPMAFLYYPETLIGVHPRVRGVRPHMLSPFNNIGEWWIAPEERKYASAR